MAGSPATGPAADAAAFTPPVGTIEPAPVGVGSGRAWLFDPVLRVERLTMRFGGLVAIDDLSFDVGRGDITALIGPNGAGKTTVFNCVTGFYEPTEGRIAMGRRQGAFAGLDALTGSGRRHDPEAGLYLLERMPDVEIAARAGVARTFQNIRLFDRLSARQNVLAAAIARRSRSTARAEALADRALDRLGLGPLADLEAGTLSYGDQRRVEIARALALEPAVLFLDEPAAGMNEAETGALMRTLQALSAESGLAILLVDHDLAFITALCDRATVLNEGRTIAEGTPREIKRDPAVIEAYLGRRAAARHAADDLPPDPSRPQETDP